MIMVMRRRLQEVNVNFLLAQPLLFKWVLDELIHNFIFKCHQGCVDPHLLA